MGVFSLTTGVMGGGGGVGLGGVREWYLSRLRYQAYITVCIISL